MTDRINGHRSAGLLALALMVPLAVACTPRVGLEAPK